MDIKIELIIVGQLFVAFLLGAIIGFEREKHGNAAGIRTYAAVTLGAALFTRSLGYPNALIYTIVSAELHSVPTNEGLKVNLKSNTELELVAELQNALAKNPS